MVLAKLHNVSRIDNTIVSEIFNVKFESLKQQFYLMKEKFFSFNFDLKVSFLRYENIICIRYSHYHQLPGAGQTGFCHHLLGSF